MLAFVCGLLGIGLVGLAVMQFQAKNQLAPIAAMLAVAMFYLAIQVYPTEAFLPSGERDVRDRARDFDEIDYHSVLGLRTGRTYPNAVNSEGEPNFWVSLYPERFLRSRADERMRDCLRRDMENIGGFDTCKIDGVRYFLGTTVILDHYNQRDANLMCEHGCFTVSGRIQPSGDIAGSVNWEIPPQESYGCLGMRSLFDTGTVEIRYNGNWRVWDETQAAHYGTEDYVNISGLRVTNTGMLPIEVVYHRIRPGYLHQNSSNRAWLCFE